jgi:RHS repeat-associated protein
VQKVPSTGSGGEFAGTWQFLYDQSGRMVQRFNGTLWQGNIYVGGRHLLEDGGGTNFSHSDWLGTERVRTTNTGTVCESIASLPFGDGQTTTGACYHSSPVHFTGKERDSESGLDTFGARYNSSSLGPFLSADPKHLSTHLLDPQTFNRYAYTRNNPLAYVDPDGRDFEKAIQDVKTFLNSVKVKFSGGFGAEAKARIGPAEVSAGASTKLNLKTGGDVALQLTHTVEEGASVSGLGGKLGTTAIAEQPIVTLTPEGKVITGGKPTGEIKGDVKVKGDAAGADVSGSKDEVGVGVSGGFGLVGGVDLTSTVEGLKALIDIPNQIVDSLKNPTPPPPPPPAPTCVPDANKKCN